MSKLKNKNKKPLVFLEEMLCNFYKLCYIHCCILFYSACLGFSRLISCRFIHLAIWQFTVQLVCQCNNVKNDWKASPTLQRAVFLLLFSYKSFAEALSNEMKTVNHLLFYIRISTQNVFTLGKARTKKKNPKTLKYDFGFLKHDGFISSKVWFLCKALLYL